MARKRKLTMTIDPEQYRVMISNKLWDMEEYTKGAGYLVLADRDRWVGELLKKYDLVEEVRRHATEQQLARLEHVRYRIKQELIIRGVVRHEGIEYSVVDGRIKRNLCDKG